MDKLRRFIIGLVGIGLSIFIACVVMIYGWGLTPKSWFWIIGVYFVGQLIAQSMVKLASFDEKADKDEAIPDWHKNPEYLEFLADQKRKML